MKRSPHARNHAWFWNRDMPPFCGPCASAAPRCCPDVIPPGKTTPRSPRASSHGVMRVVIPTAAQPTQPRALRAAACQSIVVKHHCRQTSTHAFPPGPRPSHGITHPLLLTVWMSQRCVHGSRAARPHACTHTASARPAPRSTAQRICARHKPAVPSTSYQRASAHLHTRPHACARTRRLAAAIPAPPCPAPSGIGRCRYTPSHTAAAGRGQLQRQLQTTFPRVTCRSPRVQQGGRPHGAAHAGGAQLLRGDVHGVAMRRRVARVRPPHLQPRAAAHARCRRRLCPQLRLPRPLRPGALPPPPAAPATRRTCMSSAGHSRATDPLHPRSVRGSTALSV